MWGPAQAGPGWEVLSGVCWPPGAACFREPLGPAGTPIRSVGSRSVAVQGAWRSRWTLRQVGRASWPSTQAQSDGSPSRALASAQPRGPSLGASILCQCNRQLRDHVWVSGLPGQNVTMDEGGTPLLPDSLIYQIFLSLGPADVLAAGLVCRQWQAVSRDEFLWREQFYRYYQVARDVPRHPGQGLHVAPQATRLAGRAGGRAIHMLPAEATALIPHCPDLRSGHQGTARPSHRWGAAGSRLTTVLAGRQGLGGARGTPAAEVMSPTLSGCWPLWERRLRAPAVTTPHPQRPHPGTKSFGGSMTRCPAWRSRRSGSTRTRFCTSASPTPATSSPPAPRTAPSR